MYVVQCRKYKASEKVRRRADVIYYKFKKLFTVKDGDDFAKVFMLFVIMVILRLLLCGNSADCVSASIISHRQQSLRLMHTRAVLAVHCWFRFSILCALLFLPEAVLLVIRFASLLWPLAAH